MLKYIYNQIVKFLNNCFGVLSFSSYGSDLLIKEFIKVILSTMEISVILMFTVLGVLTLLCVSMLIFGFIIRLMIKKLLSGKIGNNYIQKQENKVLVLSNAIKSAEKVREALTTKINNLKNELTEEQKKVVIVND